MLTLMLVCAFSPRVHSIPRGPLFLKLTTKRHKVTAKIDTLHNARKRKRFPNANLMVGFFAPWNGLVRDIEWTLTDVTLTGLLGIGQF